MEYLRATGLFALKIQVRSRYSVYVPTEYSGVPNVEIKDKEQTRKGFPFGNFTRQQQQQQQNGEKTATSLLCTGKVDFQNAAWCKHAIWQYDGNISNPYCMIRIERTSFFRKNVGCEM
jgi:hypothetical protein